MRVFTSFRVQLIVIMILISVIPVAIVSVILIRSAIRENSRQQVKQLESVLILKERLTKQWLLNQKANFDEIVLDATADLTHRENQFEELLLVDASGKVVSSSNPVRLGTRFTLQPSVRKGMKGNGVLLLSLFDSGDGTNRFRLCFFRQVSPSGKVPSGCLLGIAKLDALGEIMLERTGFASTAETYLVGPDHALLTQSRFKGYSPGRTYVKTEGVLAALQGKNNEPRYYRDYRNVPVIGVYSLLPNLGIVLLAEIDVSEAVEPNRNMVLTSVLISSFAGLLAIAAALFVGHGMTSPLTSLVKATERVAVGNLEVIQNIERYDEIRNLGASFNCMIVRLKDTINRLGHSEQLNRLILSNISDAVFVIDEGGQLIFVCPDVDIIFGYKCQELYKFGNIREVLGERLFDPNELESKGEIRNIEREITDKFGNRHFLLITAKLVSLQAGSVLLVCRDISERRQAEAEIIRLNAELEQRVIKRTAQLKAANNELEAFCYSVSHDLRAPLRYIDGYVELLVSRCRDGLTDKGLHYVDTIAASARQMGVLIDDLLQFARTGRTEILWKNLDMNQVLQEALNPLKERNSGRTFEWVIGELPSIRGDYALLRQVWVNLLDNAVKYTQTRESARIEVGAIAGNEEIIFVVSDRVGGEPLGSRPP